MRKGRGEGERRREYIDNSGCCFVGMVDVFGCWEVVVLLLDHSSHHLFMGLEREGGREREKEERRHKQNKIT